MVWGAIAAVYGAALAQAEAKAKTRETNTEAILAMYNAQRQAALEGRLKILNQQANVKMVGSGKCQSCHSREFRQHHGRRVCSYCRSEG